MHSCTTLSIVPFLYTLSTTFSLQLSSYSAFLTPLFIIILHPPLISPTIAVSCSIYEAELLVNAQLHRTYCCPFSFSDTLLSPLMSEVVGSPHKKHNHMNLRDTFLNVKLNFITQFFIHPLSLCPACPCNSPHPVIIPDVKPAVT